MRNKAGCFSKDAAEYFDTSVETVRKHYWHHSPHHQRPGGRNHRKKNIGHLAVADIDQIDIRDTLKPIWHEKAETARKALNRLSICLKHGAALGLNVVPYVQDTRFEEVTLFLDNDSAGEGYRKTHDDMIDMGEAVSGNRVTLLVRISGVRAVV